MTKKASQPAKSAVWSTKKRIAITAAISAGILLVALVIGGMMYWVGKKIGVFESQSIETLTKESLLQDPAFKAALEKVAKTQGCENTAYRFALEYFEPLQPLHYTGDDACLAFELVSNPGVAEPVVVIAQLPVEKQAALDDSFRDLTAVNTSSVPHNRYAVTKVTGLKRGIEYWAYVIPVDESTTWVVRFSPVTQRAAEAVEHLVGSFMPVATE